MRVKFSKILTEDFLLKNYTNKKMTAIDIAKLVGCHKRTVYDYIYKYNIDANRYDIQEIGKQFGRLTITKFLDYNNGHATVGCLCKCGKIFTTKLTYIKRGSTRSCGCYRFDLNYTGYKDISGSFWKRVQSTAKKRDLILKSL